MGRVQNSGDWKIDPARRLEPRASISQAEPDAIHPHGQIPFGGLAMASAAPATGCSTSPTWRDQPSQQSVYTWLREDVDFLERYTRAREAQADKLFKECLEIADKATPENVSVARLQVDTRKWAAARVAPKKYGDRVEHDVKGGDFQPAILIQVGGNDREDDAKLIEGD